MVYVVVDALSGLHSLARKFILRSVAETEESSATFRCARRSIISRSAVVKNVESILTRSVRLRMPVVLEAASIIAVTLSPAASSFVASLPSAVLIASGCDVFWCLDGVSPLSADSDTTMATIAIAGCTCVAPPLRRGTSSALPPRSADVNVDNSDVLQQSGRVPPLSEAVAIGGCLCVGLLHRGVCQSAVPLGSVDDPAGDCDDSSGCTARFLRRLPNLCSVRNFRARFGILITIAEQQNGRNGVACARLRPPALDRQCCQSPRSNHKPSFSHVIAMDQ